MAETGQGVAERLVDQDLLGGVGDMVVPAQHVRDLHEGVVDHDREVVGGDAVGLHDDEVVELVVLEGDGAMDQVVEDGLAGAGHLEANDRLAALVDVLLDDVRKQVAAASGVGEGLALGRGGLAQLVELLLAAEAVVGVPGVEQLLGSRLVGVEALHLEVGAVGAADSGTFIPVQAEPAHAVENRLDGLLGRAGDVGIFDAQHEGSAQMTGI